MSTPTITTSSLPGISLPAIFNIKDKEYANVLETNLKGSQSLSTTFLVTPDLALSGTDENLFNTYISDGSSSTSFYLSVPVGTFDITAPQIKSLITGDSTTTAENGFVTTNPNSELSTFSTNSVIVAEQTDDSNVRITNAGSPTTSSTVVTTKSPSDLALAEGQYIINQGSTTSVSVLGKLKAELPIGNSVDDSTVYAAVSGGPVMISVAQLVNSDATRATDVYSFTRNTMLTPTTGTKNVVDSVFDSSDALNTNAIVLKGSAELGFGWQNNGTPQLNLNEKSELGQILIGGAPATLTVYDINGAALTIYNTSNAVSADASTLTKYLGDISDIAFPYVAVAASGTLGTPDYVPAVIDTITLSTSNT
jgi:hypothetical protein